MNRRGLIRLFATAVLLMGTAVSQTDAHAKTTRRTKKTKKVAPLPTRTSKPTGQVERATDTRYQAEKAPTKRLYVAPAADASSNWAGTVNAHVMSQRVINYMEEKYTASESYLLEGNIRNFVYFYGFDTTSQDLRGTVFYGIDARKELELRGNMTRSLRGYMLGKGMLEYLSTIELTAPYVATVHKVEKASRVSVEIQSKNVDGTNTDKPWRISSGPDLGSRTFFAKANNGTWNFELRDSFAFNEFRVHSGYTYYRSYLWLKYLNVSQTLTPGYQYEFSKLWWLKGSTDVPIAGDDKASRIFYSLSVRHLF